MGTHTSKPTKTIETTETTETTLIPIAPAGDVIIKLQSVEIIVSSVVLIHRSRFFKALFTSGFSEAQALGSTIGPEFLFPDDYDYGFVALCTILHGEEPEQPDSTKDLLEITITADKYLLLHGKVASFCFLWTMRLASRGSSLEHWYALMVVAWMTRNNKCFRFATKYLVMMMPLTRRYQEFGSWIGADLIPHDIFSEYITIASPGSLRHFN